MMKSEKIVSGLRFILGFTGLPRTALLDLSDARVHQRVNHVGQQIDDDVRNRDRQETALHQRVIAGQNRLHHHAADARQRKHLFDDDGAADRRAQEDAGSR